MSFDRRVRRDEGRLFSYILTRIVPGLSSLLLERIESRDSPEVRYDGGYPGGGDGVERVVVGA